MKLLQRLRFDFGDGTAVQVRMKAISLLSTVCLVVIVLLAMCSRDPCRNERRAFGSNSPEYQQCKAREASGAGSYYGTGGAWGGYSSGGGGHK